MPKLGCAYVLTNRVSPMLKISVLRSTRRTTQIQMCERNEAQKIFFYNKNKDLWFWIRSNPVFPLKSGRCSRWNIFALDVWRVAQRAKLRRLN